MCLSAETDSALLIVETSITYSRDDMECSGCYGINCPVKGFHGRDINFGRDLKKELLGSPVEVGEERLSTTH